jgi:hypothetical protein
MGLQTFMIAITRRAAGSVLVTRAETILEKLMTRDLTMLLQKGRGACRASRRWLGLISGVVACAACTEFDEGSDSLPAAVVLPNTSAQEAGGSGQWSCLGTPPSDAPPPTLGNTMVTFSIFIADTITRQPPPGLQVSACSPLDIECVRPMADSVQPDADGMVRVPVPRNFAGFFRVLSEQTVPAVLFPDGAVEGDVTARPMLVIGQLALQALTQSQNIAIDPQMGHLLLRAYDCNRAPAAGIRFSNDRGGQPFAFVDGLPVVGQTVTDPEGTGGFLNVLPGLAVVQSLQAGGGVSTRTASGRVRSGWFTYVDLDPAP